MEWNDIECLRKASKALIIMRLGLHGLETGDAGIRTRARFQPVYALVQARTR